MTTTPADTSQVLQKIRTAGLALAVFGILGAAAGAFVAPLDFQRAVSIAFSYWTMMSIGCVAVLMIHHLTAGRWGYTIQRFCEAGTLPLLWTTPIFAAVFLVFGMEHVYPWANHEIAHHGLVAKKTGWLNQPFFWGRVAFYYLVWNAIAFAMRSWSHKLDATKDARWGIRLHSLSGPGLLITALTGSFAAVDYLMSTDPEWFSSIYVVQYLIGCVLAALAMSILVTCLMLGTVGWRNRVSPETLRRLATLMLAFCILWTYMAFSQFLIIWMGDLPSEITFYVSRGHTSWQGFTIFLIIIHFVVPFFVLMSQHTKRRPGIVAAMAALILFARFVDIEWLVTPNLHSDGLYLSWVDIPVWLGIGGLWLLHVMSRFMTRPLTAIGDPRFSAEDPHHG